MPSAKASRSKQDHRSVTFEPAKSESGNNGGTTEGSHSVANLLPEFTTSWAIQNQSKQCESNEPEAFSRNAPDAWHATYGTHVSRAIVQQGSQEFMTEVVIGRDDRVRIHNTLDYPYSAICSLEITASTGRQFVGTGWLANDDTVVTAGHCIYMPDQGGWASRIRVFPGRNGIGHLDDGIAAASMQSVEGWTRRKVPAADYGAIKLLRPASDSGSLGYVALKDKDLIRHRMYHVAGYSADKPRGTLWGHARPLKSVNPNVLHYQTDTYGGNSGGPVFMRDDNQDIYVVGIHNYGDVSGNSATRITEEVFDNISNWKDR